MADGDIGDGEADDVDAGDDAIDEGDGEDVGVTDASGTLELERASMVADGESSSFPEVASPSGSLTNAGSLAMHGS